MNFRKLITYLTMGTAAAMPLAVAQNPTILQGNYISNVFGNSNFVLNPNALTNTANVTVSNATVTRSTTTPLVATSEFLVTTSTATGSATWSTRTFDAGMKGQNCEARFSYRGFSVGSTTAQILQGANVVAQLTLTASTDPRIASINFPCGDLSSATTFRLQQATASLTGTNEIGGIYVGLATNMANVAQAEFIGSLAWPANATSDTRTGTAWQQFQTLGSVDPTIIGNVTSPNRAPRITVPNLKAGNYRIIYTGSFGAYSSTDIDVHCFFRITDGAASPTVFGTAQTVRSYGAISSNNGVWTPVLAFDFQYTGATQSMTFFLEASANSAVGNCRVETYTNAGLKIAVYRFPSSSELVVTPERQNVFGGVKAYGNSNTNTVSTLNTWTKLTSLTTLTRTVFGKADTAATNDLSITVNNMPVGTFLITASAPFHASSSAAGDNTNCFFGIADTATGGAQIGAIQVSVNGDASTPAQNSLGGTISGLYTNSSVANKTFFVQAFKVSGSGNCFAYLGLERPLTISIVPVDQPSNSTLYVQGPVLGAQTGAAIPAGFQNEFVQSVSSNLAVIAGSGGTVRTGTGITLQPGIWEIEVHNGAGTTAPNQVQAGITDTVNGSALNDSRGLNTTRYSFDAGNTCCVVYAVSRGIFRVTTAKTFYPLAVAYPAGSNFDYAFNITARRLN